MKGLKGLVVLAILVVVMVAFVGCGSENNNFDNIATMEDYQNAISYFSYSRNPKGILSISFSGHDVLDIQDTVPEFSIAFVSINYTNGLYAETSYYLFGNNGVIDNSIALPIGTIEVSIVATAIDGQEYYLRNTEVEILENKKSYLMPISFYSEEPSFGKLTITTFGDMSSLPFIKGTNRNILIGIGMTASSTENIYIKNISLTLKKDINLDTNLSVGDIACVNVYEGDKWFGGLGVLGLYRAIDLNFVCEKSTTRTLSIEVDIPSDSTIEHIAVTEVRIEAIGLLSGKTDIVSYSFNSISHSIE